MVFKLSADWMVILENKVTDKQNTSCDGKYKGRIKIYGRNCGETYIYQEAGII